MFTVMLLMIATVTVVASLSLRHVVNSLIASNQEEDDACKTLLDDPIARLRISGNRITVAEYDSGCHSSRWNDSDFRAESKADSNMEAIDNTSQKYRAAEATVSAFTGIEHCSADGTAKARSRIRSGFGF